jgi:hypothetical protein
VTPTEQVLVDALFATGERLWSTAQSNTPSAQRTRQWMSEIAPGNLVLEISSGGRHPAIDRVGEVITWPQATYGDCTIRTVDGREFSWTNCWFVRIPRNQVEQREIFEMEQSGS